MSWYIFRGVRLPEHLEESLNAYVQYGRPTGGFLEACLSNDLKDAVGRADENSLVALPAVVGWIYNRAPINSWGSRAAVKNWIETKWKWGNVNAETERT